ncbi:thiamine phosphate synthase [Bacillus sp. KH172YL63]|uniref:thiamine phosphate synthase n=1 Tax=Bacillus sp. KH172YL63 TaxID=2709784 RepID=UPI0013E41342|nr:thiamine phosphate synthase [Bacillus sp. KH172YL63]BCB03822.1 thiamine phosphate synthase [Bacillus sp. KH172YL63]
MGLKPKGHLHAISSGTQSMEEVIDIVKVIHPYADVIHLREKSWTDHDWVTAIDQLRDASVPIEKICINHRVDIAALKDVKRVQLGYQSVPVGMVKDRFPHLKVGASVHNLQEAEEAFRQGADYLLYGNIYPTSSKPGKPGAGISKLEEMAHAFPVPTIALGGVTTERVREIVSVGAHGIAVLSGIFLSQDPEESARKYQEALQREVDPLGETI